MTEIGKPKRRVASHERLRQAMPASGQVIALQHALNVKAGRRVKTFTFGELTGEILAAENSLWVLIRRPGAGGLAWRAAYLAVPYECRLEATKEGQQIKLRLDSALGKHVITLAAGGDALEQLRLTVRFVPLSPMLILFLPRDLYPLDAKDNPLGARGNVEAAQRGLNSGVLYFRIDDPKFGNVLYFQNLTAMNVLLPSYQNQPGRRGWRPVATARVLAAHARAIGNTAIPPPAGRGRNNPVGWDPRSAPSCCDA